MKKSIIFLTLLMSFQGFAQQDAVYSQYMFNQMVINPAYAGSRNTMSAVLLHRTRWLGLDGAPTTSTFSFQSDVTKSNLAWGANVAADRLGATTNMMAAVAGAYHLRLKRGKLSFGLRAGFYSSSINNSKLDFKDQTDELIIDARQNSFVPSVDFGLYYYTRKFYVTFALNHLGGPEFDYSDELSDATFNVRSYNVLGMGYAFEVSDNIIIKPTFLLKASDGFDVNLDVGVSALFHERIWFGVSARNQSSLNFLLEVNVTDFMRIGYSYDAFFNGINAASSGAHEIFLGFDFSNDKTKVTSPRYL